MRRTLRRTPTDRPLTTLAVTAAAAVVVFLTAGCTTTPPTGDAPVSENGAARFVACLEREGLDARIADGQGYVMVRTGEAASSGAVSEVGSADGDASPLMVQSGSDGTWVAPADAAYFVDDPVAHDAYATCQAEVPDFAQPRYDPDSDPSLADAREKQRISGLEFASCARDAGFAWVADPAADSFGAIALPADLTEAEFRSLLAACWDPETSDFGWQTPESGLSFDLTTVLTDVGGGRAVSSGSSRGDG